MDACKPKAWLDTRGLQVAPRLTRRILAKAKHPASSTQIVSVSSAVANARRDLRFAIHRGSAFSPETCRIERQIQ